MTIFINAPRIFRLNGKDYMYLNQEFEGNLGVGYNPHDRQKGLYQIIPSKNPDSYSHVDLKPVILAEKHVNKSGDISISRKNFLTGETIFADKVSAIPHRPNRTDDAPVANSPRLHDRGSDPHSQA